MPRIDDYREALAIGKKGLSGRDPGPIAELAGAVFRPDLQGSGRFFLRFINREVVITWPDLEFYYEDAREEIPVQQRILLLHYLEGVRSGAKVSGEWIGFQEVPDGRFYLGAFTQRAKAPLIKGFGDNPKLLVEIARGAYGAVPFNHGDHSVLVKALPKVPLVLVLWEGDEEFPPEGNILFDRSISDILSAEDIAWLAGMVVYPLIGMARKR